MVDRAAGRHPGATPNLGLALRRLRRSTPFRPEGEIHQNEMTGVAGADDSGEGSRLAPTGRAGRPFGKDAAAGCQSVADIAPQTLSARTVRLRSTRMLPECRRLPEDIGDDLAELCDGFVARSGPAKNGALTLDHNRARQPSRERVGHQKTHRRRGEISFGTGHVVSLAAH